MKNKNGHIVSKKKYKAGLKVYKKTPGIAKWGEAVQKARKELGITGWCNVKKGTPLYKKAKQIYSA
eukprot:TRINITY_DN634_c0_g1_i5.p2 TRINITY_DN634_c0_g1~~TRINITY_DN634_c0_g1_i5.p2  ORF type:complete len:66 (+),score=24.70 TRINITY_DN634_c0_g1_i5:106-303(+)